MFIYFYYFFLLSQIHPKKCLTVQALKTLTHPKFVACGTINRSPNYLLRTLFGMSQYTPGSVVVDQAGDGASLLPLHCQRHQNWNVYRANIQVSYELLGLVQYPQ